MVEESNAILEVWRDLLEAPGCGAAWVVRDAATRPWAACPSCRWLGEVLWDTGRNAPSEGCASCRGTGRCVEAPLWDYLAAHAPRWSWRRARWLEALRERLGTVPIPGGRGELARLGEVQVWFRAGDMGDIEVTVDRRGELARLEPELVLQWWPPRRIVLATPWREGIEGWAGEALRRLNAAAEDQLRCELSLGDEGARRLAAVIGEGVAGSG